MPTEFLTDEQEQAYGDYLGPPSTQQLSRYFHLDDADRERVNDRRGAGNKLGFAVQLTTVRFLGTFLAEPIDVPSDVVAYVAAQLGIHDVACLADYAARPATGWEHAAEIRRIYGRRNSLSQPRLSPGALVVHPRLVELRAAERPVRPGDGTTGRTAGAAPWRLHRLPEPQENLLELIVVGA